ncbi:pseudouridine synthase [Actinomycetaceae bacterium MB13-C1-2]|nr:pseudouridine synthase [Actinomycetaceae bacterium MB13-C1-2]
MRSPLPPRDGVGATRLHLPSEGPWPTVAEYMVARFGHLEPEVLLARFDEGGVVNIDGEPLTRHTPLNAEAFVWYYRNPPVEHQIPFEPEILYEDKDLLVVDKPHFLPTTPSGKFLQNTALVRLRNRLGNDDLSPIHRLDRLTAGVVLFSTRPETRGAYQTLFARRRVNKEYEAFTALPPAWRPETPTLGGRPFPVTVRSHLHKDRGVLRVQELPDQPPNAETVIDLLDFDETRLHLLLRPHTGQMHQLRVHLASLEAGILNDPFYPVLLDETPDDFERPLQLLARSIGFTDPLMKTPREFSSRQTLSGGRRLAG